MNYLKINTPDELLKYPDNPKFIQNQVIEYRVAHPFGLQRALKVRSTVRVYSYNDSQYWQKLDRGLIKKLNKLIEAGPFEVHLGNTFSLDHVADAYRALDSHYLGRFTLLMKCEFDMLRVSAPG